MSKIFQTQNQMIIRFPQQIADKLNLYFASPDSHDLPEIQISVDPSRFKQLDDRLSLKLNIDSETYKATVMQLPTISSTYKTLDRVNFFKSNDISQMILVHDKYQDHESIRQDQAQKIIDKNTNRTVKYKMQSGLTQPAKFIKQNNFKITPQVDQRKVQIIDKQMEQIRSQNAQNKNDDKSQTAGKKRKN